MYRVQRYCAGCGRLMRWVGSGNQSRYCCEACARDARTCAAEMCPAVRGTEERQRDAYRLD